MIKKLLIALIVAVVALLGIGMFLPGDFEVTRKIEINGRPADIYPIVADLKQWPKWTVWNKETYPDIEYTYGEKTSGLGAEYSWTGETSGNGNMKITTAKEPENLEWELNFEGFETSYGYCRFERAEKDRTDVVFGMRGNMGSNPINKYFGLMMDRMMGAEFDKNLANPEGHGREPARGSRSGSRRPRREAGRREERRQRGSRQGVASRPCL